MRQSEVIFGENNTVLYRKEIFFIYSLMDICSQTLQKAEMHEIRHKFNKRKSTVEKRRRKYVNSEHFNDNKDCFRYFE